MYKIVNNGREAEYLEIQLDRKRKIPIDVIQFHGIQSLKIIDALIIDVTNLGLLNNLKKIEFSRCTFKKAPIGLNTLININELSFWYCKNLENVEGLDSLINLNFLHLVGNEKLTRIQGLEGLTQLKYFEIFDSRALKEVPELDKLVNLEYFRIGDCQKIDLSKLNGLKKLKTFNFWGYNHLDFNTITDLVKKGVYFEGEDNEWSYSEPKIDFSNAYISSFVDNDKQFMDFIDSKKATEILQNYFRKKE